MNVFYAAAVAVFLLIGSFGAGWHFGGQGVRLSNTTAEVKKDRTDAPIIAREGQDYAAATDPLAPLAAPIVRLCYSAPVPAPGSPRPRPAESVPVPDTGRGDPGLPTYRKWDTRPLMQIARDADAQVAGLQDYIEKVCLAKPK